MFAALLATAASARAEPARPSAVALSWEAPAGCPSSERILAETDRILAGSTVRTDPPIEARARVRQEGERWLLSLETRRGAAAGSRELEGESCTALGEAMIVILVLMIDPALVSETPPRLEPEPSPEVKPPPPAAPVTVSKPAAPPPAPQDCRWGRPAIALAALGDLGALPGPAGGGELSFGLRRCAFGASAGVLGLAPRTGEAALDAGAGGDVWLLAGAGAATFRRDLGAVGLGARAGLEAGAMSGRGVGINHPDAGRALWLAASGGVTLAVPLGARLAAVLGLDLVVPLRRPRFIIDDLGAVHRPAAVTGRAALGLELAL
ncbi:MAG TPA: hypothetical protein VIG06_06355 [Kofleriaceae bacterium]